MSEYTRGDIISLWGVQESLLQSYRQIYLSSQSILVAAAFLLLEVQNPSTNTDISRVMIVLLGLATLFLWIKTTAHRRKAVTYVQAQLLEIDSGGSVANLYLHMQQHMNSQLNDTRSIERFTELVLAAKEDVWVGKLLQSLPYLFALVWVYVASAYWLI
ncbi:hypothetical protein [Vreelandella neptunia]|uniref:SMODS and SLOG-associating 2TM effector domain-containing protein n=1 Tax=Vreelandella neptunia TaxID=115551 RepID=A0ABS9S339_9GAMM|nr:hypothetical protein [Halomonas neptunia]MCH4810438.1 hypothetical protein [Halomonas neptunia]